MQISCALHSVCVVKHCLRSVSFHSDPRGEMGFLQTFHCASIPFEQRVVWKLSQGNWNVRACEGEVRWGWSCFPSQHFVPCDPALFLLSLLTPSFSSVFSGRFPCVCADLEDWLTKLLDFYSYERRRHTVENGFILGKGASNHTNYVQRQCFRIRSEAFFFFSLVFSPDFKQEEIPLARQH